MMVVLSVSFSPNPMYLPLPLAVLYLTHLAVTKKSNTLCEYKHVLNRWHGKKSPMDLLSNENVLLFH